MDAPPLTVPDIVAIVSVYNEADIFEAVLDHLTSQGIGVYVLDNWSTDETHAIARDFLGKGVVHIEMFPTQPAATFDLMATLRRKEVLARQLAGLGARWIMHYDADEIIESPWPKVSLREGLHRVESEGYNAIDLRVLLFVPTQEGFARGVCPRDHFRHFSLIERTTPLRGVKAWIQPAGPVDLAITAGHAAEFAGRRVYPIPFLNLHYPIRSTEHGRRKILQDRRPRYAASGRARGWHGHYDSVQESHAFLFNPSDPMLRVYQEEAFKREHLARTFSPDPGTLAAQFEALKKELETARQAVRDLEAARHQLRYRVADRCNAVLRRAGMQQLFKSVLTRFTGPNASSTPPASAGQIDPFST